ncbi:MAG: PaaI family thioesterase [Dehalococcoidia bacterium]
MTTDAANANNERMSKVIALTPFMKHLGMEFVDAGEGWARLKMHYQDENSTAAKALHGGAISSLIDTTGAMAAWTTAEIATPKYFGSTVGINVNYLAGAIGEDIFAEGRVLKRGKEIIYSDVRVTNGAGKLLAQGTVVYRIVEREERGGRPG